MIPLLPYVLLQCRTALLLFCYYSTYIQRMIQHQVVFVRHTGRQQAYFGSKYEIGSQLRRARFILLVHTSHYSPLKNPDYTACHPERTTTFIFKKNMLHLVPTISLRFFPRVFLSSRVTGPCPMTTHLIMRVCVRTTTSRGVPLIHIRSIC